jgi:DNA-binding CsgD family transcriptional regulator
MMHGHRIPKGQFVVMACQNHRCHRFEHMELKKTIVHYRDPKRISASHLTPEEAKVLRYYCRRVTTQTLMEVFGVSDHFIYHERKRKTPPARYRPSPAWVRRIYTVVRKGQRNSRILDAEKLKRARKDIRSAPLMRKEKKVLLRSIEGEGMASIARDLGMTSNYGYMMRNRALARLCITIGERDWIREMFKRRSSWRAWMKRNKGKPEGYRIGARYK